MLKETEKPQLICVPKRRKIPPDTILLKGIEGEAHRGEDGTHPLAQGHVLVRHMNVAEEIVTVMMKNQKRAGEEIAIGSQRENGPGHAPIQRHLQCIHAPGRAQLPLTVTKKKNRRLVAAHQEVLSLLCGA